MEFSDVVHSRRSVRDFTEKKIDAKILGKIVEAALRAPSAGNLQSYRIHIVRNQEAREGLAIAADQHFLARAPVVLVFCADITRAEGRYGERGAELYAVQDATIACVYAQLAAADEKLGSVWVGAFEPLEVARLVNAVAYEVPVAMLALGYPNGNPPATPRRPAEEIVKEI
jgi:nitroreductase